MKLKLSIALLAFLFTVNLASAQIDVQTAQISNTGPVNAYSVQFLNESPTAYVVSASISTFPSPQLYGVATGISGNLDTPNSWNYVGPGSFKGNLYVNWAGYASATFYIYIGIYDSTTDMMWYDTIVTAVSAN